MKPIIRLDQPLINKIAAGEVVERPLSVVKELLENAVDAGASTITVEIVEGGLGSIRVTDNGVGIPADQILLAFTRHATSKIATAEDLFEVGTLGFRGEALSSIAAVAQVEMITKTAGAIMGLRAEIHGGEMISSQEIGAVGGTTVLVRNLFYNTPARRKFLKKPAIEAGYISECLQKLALGNTGLAIRYINNGQVIFQTNGRGDLKTAMLSIYGHETAAKLVHIQAELEDLKLVGFMGKPEIARGNRNRQSFFVNGRLISSNLLTRAVEESARGMLPVGKFPVYALSMSLPHDAVDVNVHPTKMDVRFEDEDGVFKFVVGAVREGLTESNLIPEVRFVKPKSMEPELEQPVIPLQKQQTTDNGSLPVIARSEETTQSSTHAGSGLLRFARNDADGRLDGMKPVALPDVAPASRFTVKEEATTPSESSRFFTDYVIHGLIFETYWLVTQGESLYLIDQHAAHERVLFEELLAQTSMEALQSQTLIAPVPLRLTQLEISLLKDNLPLFARFGFEIEIHEESSLSGAMLISVPFMFKGPASTEFFTEILDKIGETGFSRAGLHAHKTEAIAMAACKAAVKAGDSMSQQEAQALLEKMLTLENPFTCPHGRPTIIELTKRELERRFKRG